MQNLPLYAVPLLQYGLGKDYSVESPSVCCSTAPGRTEIGRTSSIANFQVQLLKKYIYLSVHTPSNRFIYIECILVDFLMINISQIFYPTWQQIRRSSCLAYINHQYPVPCTPRRMGPLAETGLKEEPTQIIILKSM